MLKSTEGWINNRNGNGTDNFGFSALPAGFSYGSGNFYDEGDIRAYFWSSTEDDSNSAYDIYLYYNDFAACLGNYYKHYGISVRCLMD